MLGERSLAGCLKLAETIHLHVKVEDTEQVSRGALEAAGGVLDHGKRGFVKFRMPGRLNVIFSHIAVSADDLRECSSSRRPRPLLDHIGIDVRSVTGESRSAFDSVPAAASSLGWAHVGQGGAGQVVRCCHVVVDEKHWIFPAWTGARPVEIAFGPLRQGTGVPGCDLRPSHPALAFQDGACCPG